METLSVLPNLEGRKFGTITLGYDRVDQIRGEFSSMTQLASLVLDVPVEKLTAKAVSDFAASVAGVMPQFADPATAPPPTEGESRVFALARLLASLKSSTPSS